MKVTTYWVFWRSPSGVSCARPFEGEGAAELATGFRLGLSAAGVEARLERHDPSPHHDRADVTVLWPPQED